MVSFMHDSWACMTAGPLIIHAYALGNDISELGTLSMRENKDEMELVIGYHQLIGKVVQLKKPLVILEKQSSDGQTEYGAVGIIRSKVIFKNRPTALISKPRN